MDSPRACAHSHHQAHIRMKGASVHTAARNRAGRAVNLPTVPDADTGARTAACAHMHTRHGRDHETRDRQTFPTGPSAARGLHIPPVATVEEANTHANNHTPTRTHARAHRDAPTSRETTSHRSTKQTTRGHSRPVHVRIPCVRAQATQGVIRTPKRICTTCTHILHPIRRSIFNCKQAQTHAYTRR